MPRARLHPRPEQRGIGAHSANRVTASFEALADQLRLRAVRASYEAAIKALPNTSEPRCVRLPWGGLLSGPIDLDFDESDELSQPPG